jgi:hypothetical protein
MLTRISRRKTSRLLQFSLFHHFRPGRGEFLGLWGKPIEVSGLSSGLQVRMESRLIGNLHRKKSLIKSSLGQSIIQEI